MGIISDAVEELDKALDERLGQKADANHSHSISDIDGLQEALKTAGETPTPQPAPATVSASDVQGLDEYVKDRIPAPDGGVGSIVVNESAEVLFDQKWSGTDQEKWDKAAAWSRTFANGPRPDIRMPGRNVTLTKPVSAIQRAGQRIVGSRGPAREFGTGPTITYAGPSGTSLFAPADNTGYSYPAPPAVRDMSFDGIQFNAGIDKDFFPTVENYSGKDVQWYCSFNNCGWVGWRHIYWGFGTGVNFVGLMHLQGCADTPFRMAGSENLIAGDGSLWDSGQASWLTGNKPFLHMFGSKWTLGGVMISARQTSYQLLVSNGDGGRCIGTYFDAPDSAPTSGFQARVTGGDGLTFSGCNFKGGEGIQVSGGDNIVITGCDFNRNRGALRIESSFKGRVLLGLNSYSGTSSGVAKTPRVVRVARLDQIVSLDPSVRIDDLNGNVLRHAA